MPDWDAYILVTTVILAGFSPMTASFLQCWADRARAGAEGAPDGRSFCDHCQKTLSAIDLVPILSWLWNRGRSRCCGEPLHPTLLYAEGVILLLAIWGVLVVPWTLAIPTVLLAWGLQSVVLLTGPSPKAAQTFAAAMAVGGLACAIFFFEGRLVAHAGATLLGFALWFLARMQKTIAPDALMLLVPAGAFLGFTGLAFSGFVAIPAALAYQALKPAFYPADMRRPVMPAEAVVFGLAGGFWLVWLYYVSPMLN